MCCIDIPLCVHVSRTVSLYREIKVLHVTWGIGYQMRISVPSHTSRCVFFVYDTGTHILLVNGRLRYPEYDLVRYIVSLYRYHKWDRYSNFLLYSSTHMHTQLCCIEWRYSSDTVRYSDTAINSDTAYLLYRPGSAHPPNPWTAALQPGG